MVKDEKLLLKFLKNPQNVTLKDVIKILHMNGYEERKGKGSHLVFCNNKGSSIIIPVHNNDCKRFYKEKVKKLLFEE